MTAVTDTTPVCYLVLIGGVELLRELFSSLLMPRAIVAELLHEDALESVRVWAADLPSWISVHDNPSGPTLGMERLQAGELNAILLAETAKAEIVLLDEKSARRVATARGLRVTGTLGVLGEAATRGLTDFTVAIDRLRKTNFRYSPSLLKATLDRLDRKNRESVPEVPSKISDVLWPISAAREFAHVSRLLTSPVSWRLASRKARSSPTTPD